MSWGYWGEPTRRRPANGIKPKSGNFGKSWWAGRWLAALERLMDSGRLSRGRSYARSGQVVELNVGRKGVAAKVQGSAAKPYKVSIGFRNLTDAEWEKVGDVMASEAIYAAKLLNGEMPEGIEDAFKAAGTTLFPSAAGDLETDCSCPDWSNPCKHTAAVYYLLGERFDEDPFLIFELRGRSKDEIISTLRARRTADMPAEEEAAPAETAAEEVTVPLSALLADFWSAPAAAVLPPPRFQAPPGNALAVKRMGAPPFWRGPRTFPEVMDETYSAIGSHALDLVLGEES